MTEHQYPEGFFVSRKATARVERGGGALPVPTSCPHCKGVVELVPNSQIYNGRSYGEWPWAYRCTNKQCNSYVGLHPYTAIPLGTLANKPLREARNLAKALFQPIWQEGRMTRSEAYAWLADKMGIDRSSCHFGWFDIEQCHAAKKILIEAMP